MISRRGLLAASFFATAGCRCGVRAAVLDVPPIAADYPQEFHTEANRILDTAGKPRVFHGVAVPDVLWIAERNDAGIGYFDDRLFRAAANWRCDILRLSIAPALFRRHGPQETLRVLDASVAFARTYGLYLIVNFHTIGFPPDGRYEKLVDWQYGELYATDDAEITAFWTLVATRYRNEPAVAFYELINEPVRILPDGHFDYDSDPADWQRWRDYAEALIDRIRAVDPDKCAIVGGLEFAYDLSHAVDLPVRRPNVVYATHPYAGANWKRDWTSAFLQAATVVPVFATEFGWGEAHPEADDHGPAPYRTAILAAFDGAGISWTAWSMSHTFPPSLLAAADFTETTEYGSFIRQALARLAPK